MGRSDRQTAEKDKDRETDRARGRDRESISEHQAFPMNQCNYSYKYLFFHRCLSSSNLAIFLKCHEKILVDPFQHHIEKLGMRSELYHFAPLLSYVWFLVYLLL